MRQYLESTNGVPSHEACAPAQKSAATVMRDDFADLLRILCGCAHKMHHSPNRSVGGVFMQERLGQHESPIVIAKIQTMVDGAHKRFRSLLNTHEQDSSGALMNDPRVTPLGKVLRAMKLDELPQLVQWISGHVTGRRIFSIIGIRPQVKDAWDHQLEDTAGELRARHLQFKPGLFPIDWALPKGATLEDRLALWDEYTTLCEKHGQRAANLAITPRIFMGQVRKLWSAIRGNRETH